MYTIHRYFILAINIHMYVWFIQRKIQDKFSILIKSIILWNYIMDKWYLDTDVIIYLINNILVLYNLFIACG